MIKYQEYQMVHKHLVILTLILMQMDKPRFLAIMLLLKVGVIRKHPLMRTAGVEVVSHMTDT